MPDWSPQTHESGHSREAEAPHEFSFTGVPNLGPNAPLPSQAAAQAPRVFNTARVFRAIRSRPTDNIKVSVVDDSPTAQLFRTWISTGQLDYDIDTYTALRETVMDLIRQYVAVSMVESEISQAIISTGIDLQVATKPFIATANKLLDASVLDKLCNLTGMSEYRTEIVLREIDKGFGTARSLESEHRKREAEHAADRDWSQGTLSSIHNMFREFLATTRKSQSVVMRKPVRRRSHSKDSD